MVRMPLKRMLALVIALALALPSAALAQSAGDEQYVDPFDDSQGQQQEQVTPPSQGGGSQGGDGTAAAPTETQVVPETPSVAPSTTGAPTVQGTETLPVTGLPAAALALAGAFLVAAGATLRRRA
jgi:hypothetical protein